MEALSIKYTNFLKAYKALDRAIKVLERSIHHVPQDMHDTIVAGVIKHFELAYETAWKFLKQYLESALGIEVASPKAVFRACYEYKILPQDVTDNLIKLANDRNLTAHIYDQATAEEICKAVTCHYHALSKVVELGALIKSK
jgi:nucleotidyltransferase substrate binding protein (TIGR01987 family)